MTREELKAKSQEALDRLREGARAGHPKARAILKRMVADGQLPPEEAQWDEPASEAPKHWQETVEREPGEEG